MSISATKILLASGKKSEKYWMLFVDSSNSSFNSYSRGVEIDRNDDSIVYCGLSNSSGYGASLIKIDKNGDVLWDSYFISNAYTRGVGDHAIAQNGTVCVVGNFDGAPGFALFNGSTGSYSTSKTLSGMGAAYFVLPDMSNSTNPGFLINGYYASGYAQAFRINIDNVGNSTNNKRSTGVSSSVNHFPSAACVDFNSGAYWLGYKGSFQNKVLGNANPQTLVMELAGFSGGSYGPRAMAAVSSSKMVMYVNDGQEKIVQVENMCQPGGNSYTVNWYKEVFSGAIIALAIDKNGDILALRQLSNGVIGGTSFDGFGLTRFSGSTGAQMGDTLSWCSNANSINQGNDQTGTAVYKLYVDSTGAIYLSSRFQGTNGAANQVIMRLPHDFDTLASSGSFTTYGTYPNDIKMKMITTNTSSGSAITPAFDAGFSLSSATQTFGTGPSPSQTQPHPDLTYGTLVDL